MTEVWSHLVGLPREESPNYWEYFGNRLAEQADIPLNARILDLGCGAGSSFIPTVLKLELDDFAVAADFRWEAADECRRRSIQSGITRASWVQTDAGYLGLPSNYFDVILSGFMGWKYCFDFVLKRFTRPDIRMMEIQRVLRSGGQVLVSSWAFQEDLEWMVNTFRNILQKVAPELENLYPADQVPYSKETPEGFDIILRNAGFKNIQITSEQVNFASPDENTWWEQMRRVGMNPYFTKLKKYSSEKYNQVKEDVLKQLQSHKQENGIIFGKKVIYAKARKISYPYKKPDMLTK